MPNNELFEGLLLDEAVELFESYARTHHSVPDLDAIVEKVLSNAPQSLRTDTVRFQVATELLRVLKSLLSTNVSIAEFALGKVTSERTSVSTNRSTDEQPQLLLDLKRRFPNYASLIDAVFSSTKADHPAEPSGQDFISGPLVGNNFQPGQAIGDFTLVEHLGAGGMGTVWKAAQEQPVKRHVALKFLRTSLAPEVWQNRFRAERQALALLHHPNIASVLSAGSTDEGYPFLAMELVDGPDLVSYCLEQSLDLTERLQLFLDVCRGVLHAHQRGILHRDLKPHNILVTTVDGRPVPKLIDFGLAKATSQPLIDQSFHTALGQVLGTVDYMSPEQTRLNNADIDTRTDVYALGAILYELLTGTRPFSEHNLSTKPLDEALSIVRDSEPTRASRRLFQETLRQPSFPTELDWIVHMCLEKEPPRRYASVSSLLEDCQRFLDNEPVAAAPPSRIYRAKKFLRRYRATVVATAAIFLTLVAGLIGTGISLTFALAARRLADERAEDLATAIKDVERAELKATARAGELEVVTNFQADQLSAISPYDMGTRLRTQLLEESRSGKTPDSQASAGAAAMEQNEETSSTVDLAQLNFSEIALTSLDENLFTPTLTSINERFVDQPVVRAQLLHTLATTLQKVGLTDKGEQVEQEAISLCDKHLGPDDPRTLSALSHRAEMLITLGKLEQAQSVSEQALELALTKLPVGDSIRLACMQTRANVHSALGQILESRTLLGRAVAEAEGNHASDHAVLAGLRHLHGKALREMGDFEQAEKLFRSVLEQRKNLPSEDKLGIADTLGELGAVLESTSQFDEADGCLQECYDVTAEVLGRNHPMTLTAMNNLAFFLFSKQNAAQAEPLVLESIARHTDSLGPLHVHTLGVMNSYGSFLYHSAEYAKAVKVFEELVPKLESSAGPDHPITIAAIANLGVNYRQNNQYDLALEALEKAWKKHPTHSDLDFIRRQFFSTCISGGKPERAKQLAEDEEQFLRTSYPADSLELANQLAVPLSWYLVMSDWSAAEPLLRESVSIRERLAPDDWKTYDQQSTLGECLVKLERYAEAEPILLAATEKMHAASIPAPMRDKIGYSLDRLVELYNATHDKSKAAEWRVKLDAFQSAANR